MQTVPIETVEAVWQELGQLTQEQAGEMAQRMQDEQPAILIYLLTAEEVEDEVDAEQGWLLETGAVICEV
ncbi:MAG: hypothetical protein KDM81_21940, partial [Verrucomicrobiae bacterium]|nr:hypothetical protein [Verrucomicrobiae bacterium]